MAQMANKTNTIYGSHCSDRILSVGWDCLTQLTVTFKFYHCVILHEVKIFTSFEVRVVSVIYHDITWFVDSLTLAFDLLTVLVLSTFHFKEAIFP